MNRITKYSVSLLMILIISPLSALTFAGPRKGPGVPVTGVPFVNSRTVQIGFQTGSSSTSNTRAKLYVTRDKGATWEQSEVRAEQQQASRLTYEAPADGLYGFFIVLENEAGASSPAPTAGSAPQKWVRIDTQAPQIQLLGIKADPDFVQKREVRLRWRTEDENLTDRPVALHYRTAESKVFIPVSESLPPLCEFRWTVPEAVQGRVELKLTAVDLAGKKTEYTTDRLHINLGIAQIDGPAPEPAAGSGTARLAGIRAYGEPDASGSPVTPEARQQARRRYEQGTYYRLRGDHALAAARFEDAVKHDPGYLEAWHDLAGIHLQQGRAGEAEQLFKLILSKDPGYRPAMKGLALVQANQKNYKSARKTLERLLLLSPDDAETWLCYGDVVMFSGDRGEARDAWTEAARIEKAGVEIRRRAEKRLEMYSADASDVIGIDP